MSAPPPPPPHGEAPKSTGGSGLPPGNYDIFVIPEHSAGAGFLYLPSLRPNINSFVAGFASALAVIALGNSMAPAFKAWWANFQGMGNVGMVMLVIAVGLGAWSLGRIQQDDTPSGSGAAGGGSPRGAGAGASASPRSGAGSGSPGGTGSHSHPGAANGSAGYGSSSPPPPPPPPPQNENQRPGQPPPASGPPPHSPPPHSPPPRQNHQQQQQQQQSERPKSSWQQNQQQNYQRQAPPPQPNTSRTDSAKGAWERAREEMRRKEEERKAQEAENRRREEAAQRLREIREREARERLERERRDREEKERRERELKEKRDKELQERLEREQREKELKEQRERIEKELREKIAKEREKEEQEKAAQEQRAKDLKAQIEREARELAEKERLKKAQEEEEERKKELDRMSRKGSSYAFSAVGERTNPWPNGKPPAAAAPSVAASSSPAGAAGGSKPRSAPPPTTAAPSSFGGVGGGAASAKKPAASSTGPSKQAHVQDEDETYSFRPYDKPKRPQPARKKSISDLSDGSWAPSQSTARTTPPPSMRQPYTTNDPDKIVIRAVYGFLNQFAKTPSSQLLSGVGSVTDGLILRITTEGLFIDDDVRGVPQREWDVKAWTLKLVEVWCPAHAVALANSAANESAVKPSAANVNNATFLPRAAWRKAFAAGGVRGEPRPLTDDNADAYLADMLRECKALCGLGLCDTGVSPPSAFGAFGAFDDSASSHSHHSSRSGTKSNPQTGEWKSKGLHLLRATVRDQEGKRFLFVLNQEEAWKVSMGLQRLRRGTQVRSLGVAGLSGMEVRSTLEMLGWT